MSRLTNSDFMNNLQNQKMVKNSGEHTITSPGGNTTAYSNLAVPKILSRSNAHRNWQFKTQDKKEDKGSKT